MERITLSLKSVYMLLMTDDFPIYSESVVNKTDRKGQTLLRFWRHMIAEEFRILPSGRMIWDGDEKRNRNTSYLCNRSMELRCYQDYAKEISAQINTASLLSQIGRFVEFLDGRKYKQDVLIRRVRELVRLAEEEDPCVSKEIANQIKTAAASALQEEGGLGELFQAGYVLTLLTLYAAAGEAMDDAVMDVLRGEGYSMEKLWLSYRKKQTRSRQVVFLTVHSGMLQDNLLPGNRFFGREEELYDLREMAAAQRKCLISGVGGIGKTELLRQLLRRCVEEGIADQIAVVPYMNNIIESFGQSFPGFRLKEPEEEFHRILYQIGQSAEEGCRILLLIDNVCKSIEEDSALGQLCSLPCGVVITTRNQCMEGFETYRVLPPSLSAGMLIFRDNYGRPFTGEDRAALADLLEDGTLRHPAILRLMARAAKNKHWSVEELKCQLKQKGTSISWKEGNRTVRLNQLYRKLYSYMRIPRECQTLVELFTLLPRASYSVDFLRENFPEAAGNLSAESDGANFPEEELAALAVGGWLEEDGSGYAMHPLIAQSLRQKTQTEEGTGPLIGHIRDRLLALLGLLEEGQSIQSEYWSEDFHHVCRIFLSICRFLSGAITRELMMAILNALLIVYPVRQEAEEYERWLEELMNRCAERDDRTEVLLCTVLGRLGRGVATQFRRVYERQKEGLTVCRPLFLDFCIQGGVCLMHKREFALAERMLREVLCEDANPQQKAEAYNMLHLLCEFQGDWDGQLQWGKAGEEYVTAHPECGEYIASRILCIRWIDAIKRGQKETAEALREKLQSLHSEDFMGVLRISYENTAGLYELTFGSLEKALAHYSGCLEQYLLYHGKSIEYYVTLGQMAIALQRLGRYEEAISVYGTILEYARDNGDVNMLQRFSNNLAVLYLDMGKPEEALLPLRTALEEGRKLGGIALAEALRNTARVYGLSGDSDLEYRHYQEAVPLLEEAYGSEHLRVLEARARLAKLEEEKWRFL